MNTYKSNSKIVSDKVKNHVLDCYDDHDNAIEDLRADTEAAGGSANLVDGGQFEIYYDDQRAFLNSLHLNNNSNKEFSDQEVWEMYKLLVSRAIDKLIKKEAK